MQAISTSIGTGDTKHISISQVINEPWSQFLTIDVKLATSTQLLACVKFNYPQGINNESMKKLNLEFNYFRGLFPLKVFIGGPPCSGKTFLAKKLSEDYGIPHLTIKDIVNMGMALKDEYGIKLQKRIEELTDQAEADYEKNKKKKDPEFDRANYHPRLPDDILHDLTKIQLNSAGCMNKGFILDGYPRSINDTREIFMIKSFKSSQREAGEEAHEEV
jgi:adenylate kinase